MGLENWLAQLRIITQQTVHLGSKTRNPKQTEERGQDGWKR